MIFPVTVICLLYHFSLSKITDFDSSLTMNLSPLAYKLLSFIGCFRGPPGIK